MNKRTAIIFTIIALIVGVIVGGLSIATIYSHRINQLIANYKSRLNNIDVGKATAEAENEVDVLKALRTGQITNAIYFEEGALQINLIQIEFGVTKTNRNDFINYPPFVDTLRKVKAYRDEFPYETNSYFEKCISEKVFALLSEDRSSTNVTTSKNP